MKKIYSLMVIVLALAATAHAQITFTVVNNNPDSWEQLALYSWDNSGGDNVEAFGVWPGVVLYDGTTLTNNDAVTVSKSGNTYTVTVKNYVSTMNLILNNNNQGSQIDLVEMEDGKNYEIPAPPSTPGGFSQAIHFINDGWTAVSLYEWGNAGAQQLYGAWPGVVIVNESGEVNPNANELIKVELEFTTDEGYPVYKIYFGDNTGFQNLIFNNKGGGQQFDVDYEDDGFYNTNGKTNPVTGINNVIVKGNNSKMASYSLGGNRVSSTYRGIVISEGKKYVVK